MNRMTTLVAGAAGLAERIGTAMRWAGPTVARLTIGIVFVQSGWGKLHDLEKVTGYFTELGIPMPEANALECFWTRVISQPRAHRIPSRPRSAVMAYASALNAWVFVGGIRFEKRSSLSLSFRTKRPPPRWTKLSVCRVFSLRAISRCEVYVIRNSSYARRETGR